MRFLKLQEGTRRVWSLSKKKALSLLSRDQGICLTAITAVEEEDKDNGPGFRLFFYAPKPTVLDVVWGVG